MPPAVAEHIGSQTPTHLLTAGRVDYSDVDSVLQLADGLVDIDGNLVQVDPFQELCLREGLGREYLPMRGSRWSAYEFEIELSRQNGKSLIFELRALAGLYIFRERSITYSAHTGEAATNAFRRIEALIDSSDELRRDVRQMYRTPAREEIHLKNGRILKFRTRTARGGRSLAADLVIIDEDQDVTDDHVAALMPLMASRSQKGDPQIWYGGSAGTRKSTVKGRLIKRAMLELQRREHGQAPVDARLVVARWAADLDVDDPADERVWAKVNPAKGVRISRDYIHTEYLAMNAELDPARFARERLGVGDYPRDASEDWALPKAWWENGQDRDSKMVGPVVFSVEVKLDRSAASISAAGLREDGAKQIETISNELGVAWTIPELVRLTQQHENLGVVIDPAGPANSLIGPLRDAGVTVILLRTQDVTQAWAKFFDAFAISADPKTRPTIFHTGGLVLTASVAQADIRNVQGATTWKRSGTGDPTAIISATWAAHGLDLADRNPKATGVSRRVTNQFEIAAAQRRRARGFDPRTSRF